MPLPTNVDVLIVGAGPVGLVLAAELGAFGVSTLLLEQNPNISTHPRANTHSARSMEIYRRLGIATAFRQAGLPDDRPTDISYSTRLLGAEFARVSLPSPREALKNAEIGNDAWPTPEPQFRSSQLFLEPILKDRVLCEKSIHLTYGQRVTDCAEVNDGVRVTCEPSEGGEPRYVTARYVVGCDGGRSFVRRTMGARFEGESGIDLDFMGGRMVATYFRAPDLIERMGRPPAWQYWSINPDMRCVMVAIDGKQNFLIHFQLRPDESVETFDFASRIAQVAGEPIAVEILSATTWRAGQALVANRYCAGRMLLAGDSAHLFTPAGGFGLNTGIEDAVNLGWKLAAVCQGWGASDLLQTYDTERKAIASRNTSAALSLAKAIGECPVSADIEAHGPDGDAARRRAAEHILAYAPQEFEAPGIQLGARYDDSPIIASDEAPPPDEPTRYLPTSIPGGRAPHVWLDQGVSTLDHLGHCFTILRIKSGGDSSAETLVEAASARGIPLKLIDIDPVAAAGLYTHTLTLVRPDQHIAWRGEEILSPSALLDHVLGFSGAVATLNRSTATAR
ncbi:FAD-dependent monooxygenase [Microvirga sp. 2YAF29]|uniref:FAD-dependent monooxygenase n=1 Tax=Microvirga sp. 2YAF29 TaxID=3233031 RepID=UPI003F9690AE